MPIYKKQTPVLGQSLDAVITLILFDARPQETPVNIPYIPYIYTN